MSNEIGDRMTDNEVFRFLESGGIGVLGLAENNRAYTFPIAFAYDRENERCLFRFVNAQQSQKDEFIAETETASLTVYEWTDPEDWQSVVIHGSLQPLPTDEIAHAAALFSNVGAQAALDVFNRPLSSYDTEWYELDVTELTGRQAP